MTHIGLISIVVRDYGEAIAFYTQSLGFELVEDIPQEGKRWVVVAPPSGGTQLLLAKASTDEQRAAIGNQTGGRVLLFLHTDDFDTEYERMLQKGVVFLEEPRDEAYGKVVVFNDLYGNKWDLIQLNS
jgi:catechol 2,3-dioxygenase-like lactoylglutathione lyase family enzyme